MPSNGFVKSERGGEARLLNAAVRSGMGFKRAACMLANFLSAREVLPDVREHISLIAKGYVGQLLREWNQSLGGFGILSKKLFADLTRSHAISS